MAESSLETQIDFFLEQFKRNSSKAMEERTTVSRSRSSYLDAESPGSAATHVPCSHASWSWSRTKFPANTAMAQVDEAEKEASEVLHSLLSVERIEKSEVILENNENQSPSSQSFQSNAAPGSDVVEGEAEMQWPAPVTLTAHSIFSTIDGNSHFQQNQIDEQQVIWEGHAIQVDNGNQHINAIYASPIEEAPQSPKRPPANTSTKSKTPPKSTKKKQPPKKKKKSLLDPNSNGNDSTKLEESSAQVKERFKRGCECQDESCFRGLNPESVYKHRLNIAELTKGEHDMYLMGVTMACLANPDTTVRHKERRRLRAQYVYQGRRVCLDAFLYLENCTHYQLKRIRKHVMTHGVAPRVHGNHGKKPHNTFPLDIYYHATEFLKQYLEQYTGERDIVNTKQPIQLPWDVTRKNLHDAYKEYGQILEPGIKLMGYSTFRHFMKEQFPHVKFCKVEPKTASAPQQQNQTQQQQQQQSQQQQPQPQQESTQIHQHTIQKSAQIIERPREQQIQKCVINNEVQQVIPLVVAQPNDGSGTQHHQQTFLVTPVSQIIPNGTQNPNGHAPANAYSYQLTNAGYVINEQDESVTPCEEIEMVNTIQAEPLGLNDVAELLHSQYAIITGGKSKEGCPIITFPDNNNFQLLTDAEYQRLMLYLTSVPSLQEADLGFHLIIDRRKDRWNSVKTVLLKISVYFPGLIHVVYVIKPASFLQKALSEVSNKLFKDEFKFRMIVLSTVEELYEYLDLNQITSDLGGNLRYYHEEWMQRRTEFEKFSLVTKQVSNALDKFTKIIDEAELPNNVDTTQQILNTQTLDYSELKEEILAAARHGEDLLCCIKRKSTHDDSSTYSDTMGDVLAIERLLVQLEETERTFDDFWQQHSAKLRHCLELRRFEQDFRELQVNFNSHLKIVHDMIEVGETLSRIDDLSKDVIAFEKLCLVDIERAEEVVSSGQSLIQNKHFCPIQCVEPKCCELITMREILVEKLLKRKDILISNRKILEDIEKANDWCTKGGHLLNARQVDKNLDSDVAKLFIQDIEDFLNTTKENFDCSSKDVLHLQGSVTVEVKSRLAQMLQRIEEVVFLSKERITNLNSLIKPEHLVHEMAGSNQMLGGSASNSDKTTVKKICRIPKSESSEKHIELAFYESYLTPEIEELNKVKTGHVLAELIETEKFYVSELLSVIRGYKMEVNSEELQHLVTPKLADNINVIFGNLDEIYNFHAHVFLQDLENCISSIDLVALCFVQRRDSFFRLYSCYCQNIPKSEQLRETLVDSNMFFQTCQRKLGHKLPLAAYLLKPVQRITKYQLLLKDLLRYSEGEKCCKELQQALDCMLVVLKCVNDSMHQISITGFPVDLSQQGDLLLQGSFSVWVENKKDLRLRLKPMRRHIFLYQKSILFCKVASKSSHNKATYHFKHYLKMSQIGLTESVKGDARKFEIWLQGRLEVHTIQASNIEQKQSWVNEIKRVLLNQLEELKGERIKQYTAQTHSRPLRQTTSWEKQKTSPHVSLANSHRALSCDTDHQPPAISSEPLEHLEGENWSSDCSNSDDEEHPNKNAVPSGRYVALADYCAIGISEVNIREGDMVELLKVGCAGWWFVKVIGSSMEGWAPAAFLENLHRRSSRSSSKSHDKLNDE